METPISPEGSRREGVEVFSITLADGNLWGLALPSPRLRPDVVEGLDALGRTTRTVRLLTEFGYPLEIRRLIDDVRSACDRGEVKGQYEALILLAAALITRAHDIDPSTAAALLEMDIADLPGFVEAVLSVVSGSLPAISQPVRKGEVDG